MNRTYSPQMRERAVRMLAEAGPERPGMINAKRTTSSRLAGAAANAVGPE